MHIAMCSALLLHLVWPASAMPVTFCQNTERQIESILNLLQIIRKTVNRTPVNLTKQRESMPTLNIDECALVQRLTNYQACELHLSPEIIEITYMKAETKGLVENLQGFKTTSCVLSPAVCPYSELPMWSKIDVLLKLWSQDVAACNDILQSMCSSSNYNSV
ncbi:hypothetical protein QTP70_019162 [Hemibagrus guttatus]|uniref:Uncharacterized protein n=1 Tax=Hemibagrus guttatus TaxID=175788 RepID=A0AAE0RH90_9TELE|nr:hypothetical protein QTP70_019162 [Hemibagrus guttatus]